MKKLLLILFIILFIWNIIMIVIKKIERLKKINSGIKIFNIGSSHGLCSFNYKYTRKYKNSSYNFGWHSQTFYYDYLVLKNYFNKISRDGICFIPISYFSFSSKKRWEKADFIYEKTLKFYLLEGEDRKRAFILQYLPLYASIIKNSKFKNTSKTKSSIERIKKHVEILKTQNEKESLLQLEKIIELLLIKNIKVVLITTPFKKEYNDFFSEELLNKNFYDNIKIIKNQYKLIYIDFSHEYKTFNQEKYFLDYDHLSEEGSKIFMQELKKQLKKEGIEI